MNENPTTDSPLPNDRETAATPAPAEAETHEAAAEAPRAEASSMEGDADASAKAESIAAPPISSAAETPREASQTPGPHTPEPAAPEPKSAPTRDLAPFIDAQRIDPPPMGAAAGYRLNGPSKGSRGWMRVWGVRAAALVAGLVVVGAGAAPFVMDRGAEARGEETQKLAEAIKALNAKVDALERPRDETADLRKAFAELKGGLASTRDVTASLAQISARFDKLDHEQDSRIEKLTERVDHDVAARTSEIATRLERLEKKASAPVVAALAPKPAVAALAPKPAPTPPAPAALPRQATLLPPTNVSKDTTASVAPPKAAIQGWVLREVLDNDAALVEGRFGMREVAEGDVLPGAGRVERIERRGDGWVVVTSLGFIPMAREE